MRRFLWLLLLSYYAHHGCVVAEQNQTDNQRQSKFSLFQVVKFRNEACETNDHRNGTCYTSEECLHRGGMAKGPCASSFGVCCVFSITCGGKSSENGTYFESGDKIEAGHCSASICKINANICKLRLDFTTFVITGPSTRVGSVGKEIFGQLGQGANDILCSDAGQCLTDTFTVAAGLPTICGTMTNEHVYVDALENCHKMDINLGQAGVQAEIPARQWKILVSQIPCNSPVLPPPGCNQYFYGPSGVGIVSSFNFGGGRHLANQKQRICVRREINQCQICWTQTAAIDFQLSGKSNLAGGFVAGTLCCGYGADGKATKGYDCLMIPEAVGGNTRFCGRLLVLAAGNVEKTICSQRIPFEVTFHSDNYELATANPESTKSAGFKLAYIQSKC